MQECHLYIYNFRCNDKMSSNSETCKNDSNSWRKRKRTGGIRRKCLREYLKIKNNICTEAETSLAANANYSTDPSTSRPVQEGSVSVSRNFTSTSQILDKNDDSYVEDTDSSSSSLAENVSEFNKNIDFRNNLRDWAMNKNISQAAVKDLLGVINHRFATLLMGSMANFSFWVPPT